MERRLARIKEGAVVFQDRSFPHWGKDIGSKEPQTVFEVIRYSVEHNRHDLVAWGYGLKTDQFGEGAYGNGALFVKDEDVMFLTDEEALTIPPFKKRNPPKEKKDTTFFDAFCVLGDLRELELKVNLDLIDLALKKGEKAYNSNK